MNLVKRTRYQFGYVELKSRRRVPDVWVIRFLVKTEVGRKYASRPIGTKEQLPTRRHAEKAAEAIRLELNSADHNPKLTFGGLIERYKLDKMPERYSTRASYLSCLDVHVAPKWGDWTLEQIAKVPYEVEKCFNELTLAPKTKGHIKGLMHRLFECAMKWGLYPIGRNPNGTRRNQKCEQASAPAAGAFFRRVLEADRVLGRALPLHGPDLSVPGTSHQRGHGAEASSTRP